MRKENAQAAPSTILEGLTSIRSLLHGREKGVNERPIYEVLYDRARAQKLGRSLSYILAKSHEMGFSVTETDAETIEELATGATHGGIVARCGERPLPSLESSLESIQPYGFYATLDGIEDPYNFAYAIRSLYACGADGIIVSERNWLSAAGVVARSSAGAAEEVPMYLSKTEDAILLLKQKGYTAVAADMDTEQELGKTPLPCPVLLIAGGEKRGISRSVLDLVDVKVKIPYESDFRASLSAASAVTIFAYEIMRQRRA